MARSTRNKEDDQLMCSTYGTVQYSTVFLSLAVETVQRSYHSPCGKLQLYITVPYHPFSHAERNERTNCNPDGWREFASHARISHQMIVDIVAPLHVEPTSQWSHPPLQMQNSERFFRKWHNTAPARHHTTQINLHKTYVPTYSSTVHNPCCSPN